MKLRKLGDFSARKYFCIGAVLGAGLIQTYFASASDHCLQNATNDDLVQELSRRLESGAPEQPRYKILFSAINYNSGYAYLEFSSIDLQTGSVIEKTSLDLMAKDYVNELSEKLTRRFKATGKGLYAYCRPYNTGYEYLVKNLVTEDGKNKKVDASNLLPTEDCRKQAAGINE